MIFYGLFILDTNWLHERCQQSLNSYAYYFWFDVIFKYYIIPQSDSYDTLSEYY